MRKRFVYAFLALALVLAGCGTQPSDGSTVPTAATVPAETTVPTEPLPTVVTETVREQPYLQRIERSDQSVFEGPGYDYCFVDTVREHGTYTITEETVDCEGNLWGKLKSGIGWVDLTEIRSGNYVSAFISANYADEDLLRHGTYHHYSTEAEYSVPVAFRAYGTLHEVTIFGMELKEEGCVPADDLYTLSELTGDKPLVAELDFPGDMSMYGIRFLDEHGNSHTYYIHISGRNGALMLTTD